MTSSPQITLSLHDNFDSSFLLTKDSCGRVENTRAVEADDNHIHKPHLLEKWDLERDGISPVSHREGAPASEIWV